jgi:LacI family transcriptional regulator
MPEKATIYEVAKRVGVSTATVSRVLNDSPRVSQETKNQVLEAIEELNFTPQLTARKLATGEPQMMAVVVPSFTTPYYNEVLKGIKDEIANIDLDMMMYNTGSKNPEERMKHFFERGMADAVIILSIALPDEVHKQLQANRIPTVLVNTKHADYNYYHVDDYKGSYLAGTYLAEQGFKSIGLISSASETKSSAERNRGFMDALKEHNISISDEYIAKGESEKHAGFSEEAGYEAIEEMKEHGSFPEAIFCLNDTLAIGAMYALSRLNIKVPDDIAIMGYDNIKLSKYYDLTTIDQQMYTTGKKAIQRLSQIVQGDQEIHQEDVEPQLVERGSTQRK